MTYLTNGAAHHKAPPKFRLRHAALGISAIAAAAAISTLLYEKPEAQAFIAGKVYISELAIGASEGLVEQGWHNDAILWRASRLTERQNELRTHLGEKEVDDLDQIRAIGHSQAANGEWTEAALDGYLRAAETDLDTAYALQARLDGRMPQTLMLHAEVSRVVLKDTAPELADIYHMSALSRMIEVDIGTQSLIAEDGSSPMLERVRADVMAAMPVYLTAADREQIASLPNTPLMLYASEAGLSMQNPDHTVLHYSIEHVPEVYMGKDALRWGYTVSPYESAHGLAIQASLQGPADVIAGQAYEDEFPNGLPPGVELLPEELWEPIPMVGDPETLRRLGHSEEEISGQMPSPVGNRSLQDNEAMLQNASFQRKADPEDGCSSVCSMEF